MEEAGHSLAGGALRPGSRGLDRGSAPRGPRRRAWWGSAPRGSGGGERLGVDVAEEGIAGLPRPVVLTSGFVHASVIKCLAMLGIGRACCERLSVDNRGTLDVEALERRLASMGDEPAIVVATAGEVNSGRFDPLGRRGRPMRAIRRVAPRGRRLRALRPRRARRGGTSRTGSSGPTPSRRTPTSGSMCPTTAASPWCASGRSWPRRSAWWPPTCHRAPVMERRRGCRPTWGRSAVAARGALPIFAALLSEGRAGIRAMVEGHVLLADQLRGLVAAAPDLELVDETRLNVVPFRFAPRGVRRRDLDPLNRALGQRVLEDGPGLCGGRRATAAWSA